MSQTARDVALTALLRMENDAAYSNIVLDTVLKQTSLSPRDSALAAHIFYGVLERKITLDYTVSKLSRTPLKKIHTTVLTIIRMGLYQLYFMDKIPVSAAVNESVNLCKRNNQYKASGFVNGILRTAVRNGKLSMPEEKDEENYLSVRYSCPIPIVHLWIQSYGKDITLKILDALSGRPPVFARVNTLKTTKEELKDKLLQDGVRAEDTSESQTLLLSDTGSVEHLKAYQDGLFHIQDLASQLCCSVLDVQAGQTVLDVCAAPGGKSFTLAQMMNNQGRIVSGDLYEARLNLIQDGAKRLGIDIIETQCGDAIKGHYPMADRILCDVPCSGLGVIRRKPELRYKEDLGLKSLPPLQYEILSNCSRYLKPNGILVYSTCTLNPKENQQNVRKFLEQHTDFEPYPFHLPQKQDDFRERENECTLFPYNGTDGFFISAFRKRGIKS
ncbi:MAG: 16S rRNA (cytosine(967)-C(5))-methyltransferase RsmB [Acutalibacteraceae bacterium]